MENGLEFYQRVYRLMKESLGAVKELVLPNLGQLKEEDLRILFEIREVREKLLDIFSSKECFAVCHKCGGRCCQKEISHLKWGDLFYLVALNPELEIPQPDLEFLKARSDCLFLSENGCLLGSHRPNKCLSFAGCPELGELGIPEKIEQKLSYLAGDRSLSDFIDEKARVWVQTILKPEIILEGEKELNIPEQPCIARLPFHLASPEKNIFVSLVKAIKTQSLASPFYFVLPSYLEDKNV